MELFNAEVAVASLGPLLAGLLLTCELTLIVIVLALVLGLFVAIIRLYAPRPIAWLAVAYVEVMRGTPLLLQLIYVYYVLPELGIRLDAFTASVVLVWSVTIMLAKSRISLSCVFCSASLADSISNKSLAPAALTKPAASVGIGAAAAAFIAMSFAIASLLADGPIVARDTENVATSFPGFVSTARGCGLDISAE